MVYYNATDNMIYFVELKRNGDYRLYSGNPRVSGKSVENEPEVYKQMENYANGFKALDANGALTEYYRTLLAIKKSLTLVDIDDENIKSVKLELKPILLVSDYRGEKPWQPDKGRFSATGALKYLAVPSDKVAEFKV
jgi:hypothetical protein